MLGYDFEIIYKKRKQKVVVDAFQGNNKTMKTYFVLFPFYKFIGWKKQGHNGRRIKRHGISFNNYKGTQLH
jgi:hypothetical protein